ncbi:hypothetical protein CHUAL_010473 [Chamberlinius hualienensis]
MWNVVVTVTTTCLLLVVDQMELMLVLNNTEDAAADNETFAPGNHSNVSTGYPTSSSKMIIEVLPTIEEWDFVGYKLGDPCEDSCYDNLSHAFCNRSSKTCQCEPSHPIALDDSICLQPVLLGETCQYTKACVFTDPYSTCAHVTPLQAKCSCRDHYRITSIKGREKCIRDVLSDADIPSVFVLGIGLSIFTGLTCLVLRLFSRARFGSHRYRYANANQTPPIMMTGMTTPASVPASRRSSMRSGSTPGSRRPSYSVAASYSRPGSRRPSVASVRSQMSTRSYNRCERSYDRNHDPLRLTMSAPPIRHDLHSPSNNIRILEQKFAQHSGYIPRREPPEKYEKEWSRHSSFEIIADVISEAPEKA